MRIVSLVALLSAAAACTFQPGSMEHQSTLYTSARGVALHDDGSVAQVGMNGTTCDVYVRSGMIGTDYDYPTEDERVTDFGVVQGWPKVVVVDDDTIHVQDVDGDWTQTPTEIYQPGVTDVQVYEKGIVVLGGNAQNDDGVTMQWMDLGVGDPVELTFGNGVDVGGMTVDPISGQAWVSTSEGVVSVTPDGVAPVGVDAELIAWDAAAQALYVADRNSRVVRALEADGAERWSVELDGVVQSLTDLGERAAAAVSIRKYSGTGEIVLLDGLTGETLEVMVTPAPAPDIESSGDGSTVALVLPGQVRFYDATAGE